MPPKSKKKTPTKKELREIIDLDLEREELERVAHEKRVLEETEKTEKKAAGNYDYFITDLFQDKTIVDWFFFHFVKNFTQLIPLYFTFKIEKKDGEKKERPRKVKSQAHVALSPQESDSEYCENEGEAEAEDSEEEGQEEDAEIGSEEEWDDDEEDDELRIVEKPPPQKVTQKVAQKVIATKKIKKVAAITKRPGTPAGPKPAKTSTKVGKVISLLKDLSLTGDGCGVDGCEPGACKAILNTFTIRRGATIIRGKDDIRKMLYKLQGKGLVKRKRDTPPPQADDDDVEEDDDDVDDSDGNHVDGDGPASKKSKTSKKNYMFTLPDQADMDISTNENINRPTTICVGSGFYVSAAQIKGKAGTRDYSYPALCFTKQSGEKGAEKEYTLNVNFRLLPKIIDALTTLNARSLW